MRLSDALEQLADRLASGNQRNRPVLQIGQSGLMIDADRAIDRCQEIAGAEGPVEWLAAVGSCRADDLSAADAAASEQDRHDTRPMSAAASFAVDPRRAAELAEGGDERRIEQPA